MVTPTKPDLAQIRAELRQMISSAVDADLDDIDDETPLLDYVTSSLVLLAGIRAIYDRFGVLIPLRPLLEGAGNLRALAAFIEQALGAQGGNVRPASARKASDRSKEPRIPLTAAQQHIGFLARYSAGSSAAFNESVAVRLTGPLHGPALQAAIEAVVERYEALRAVLLEDSDALTLSSDRFELPISHSSEDALAVRAAEVAGRPFSADEPLFRAELLRAAEADHVLVLAGHALVLDHAALLVVLDDIAESYGAFARGEDLAPRRTAGRLTTAVAAAADDASRSGAEAYWASVFADGVHRLELPTDHRRPPVKSYDGARVRAALPTDVAAALKALPQPAEVVLGAFTLLLHRLTGQSDLVVGLPANPLRVTEERPEVGTTRNMLPIRSRYDGRLGLSAHVAATTARLSDANRHHHLGLTDIIRILKIARDQSRPALFSAAFRLEAYDRSAQFQGLRTSVVPTPVQHARYDLELILAFSPDSTEVRFDYSTELFDEATILRWAQGFLEFLRAGLDDPSRPGALLPVMSEQERRQVLSDWNGTAVAYPRDRTVLDLMAERALATPDRKAIRGEGGELTYAELMARCGAIAAMLHQGGVGAGERVAILLPRTPDLVAAMLATWHVGAAYVPLDPDLPAKRKTFMLKDAAVRVIVTAGDLVGLVNDAAGVRRLCIDAQETVGPAPMRAAGMASAAAYVIYTSGSTGQPKGVEVTHRSLLNVLLGARRRLRFSDSSSLLAVTTASFDISLPELLVPLLAGGLLELGEEGLAADGVRLAERIERCQPSYVQATPSTWKLVLAAGWSGSKELCVGATGEALPRELAEQLILRAGEVWNLYGPTETAVWSAAHRVTSAPGEPVRIGRPWDNTQLYILDEQMQPVPIGAAGELYIGGAGVACGYVGRPELTSQRFVASPFAAGERLYRTGDLARRLPDGDIVCLGRLDHQVKIHGYRVELEEVERSLRTVAGIRDAVVATWIDGGGDRQLVAHVIAADEAALTPAVIRDHLRQTLPEAMIPTHVRFADRFPLTTSGKVDRAALPPPDARHGARRMVTPPETLTERKAAEIWAKVLRVGASQVSRDDDFMDLGGHSLKMTHLMVEVRKAFGVHFSMRDFFAASTLRTFAALIDELKRAPADDTSRYVAMHARDSEWGRQRMLFLRREAELPPALAPARGLTYEPCKLRNVLLTGATGFLGAYMVAEILRNTDAQLHCLVRSKQSADSKGRIEAQLKTYELWGGDGAWHEAWETRVHIVSGDVILPRLGVADGVYEGLAREIDAIIHSAAHVNFIYPYEALKATNVLGLHEIVRFAFHARIKPVHYLSTAAIWPMGAEYKFHEADSLDHGKLLNLGYDEAKWVGERCLVNAADRGLPVARYRPGEVGGDSRSGRAVLNHFLVAAFKGFLQFGALPPVDTHLDVAPVDYVAKAIVHMAFNGNPLGRAFHLTNPRACHMRDALAFLRKAGYRFQEIPFDELRRKLVEDQSFANNALFPYQAALESMDDRSLQLPRYDCRQTQRELEGSGISCPPLDEQLLGTYLRHLRSVGFIPDPDQLPGRPPDQVQVTGTPARARVASTHHATA